MFPEAPYGCLRHARRRYKMSNDLTRHNLYLVSDVHSYYGALMRALTEAGFFKDDDGVLVLLGDALDRGDKPLALIDFLLDLKARDRLIYIRGNHEELLSDMMHSMTNGTFAQSSFSYIADGTFDTAISLANSYYDEQEKRHKYYSEELCFNHDTAQTNASELVRRIRESRYYQELHRHALDYYETENYVFCHGWIPVHVKRDTDRDVYQYRSDWRDADYSDWKRARWINGMSACVKDGVSVKGKTVICGHYYTGWGHFFLHGSMTRLVEPFVDKDIIAIDAGMSPSDTDETKRIYCVVISHDGKAVFEQKVLHVPEDNEA